MTGQDDILPYYHHHHRHHHHHHHHHHRHLVNDLTRDRYDLPVFLPERHKAFQTINQARQPDGQSDDVGYGGVGGGDHGGDGDGDCNHILHHHLMVSPSLTKIFIDSETKVGVCKLKTFL